jgi:hypothetical protein
MEAAGDRVYFEDYNDNQLFYYTISTGEWSKRLEEYSTSRPYYGNIIFTGGDLVYVFSGFQNQTIWKYSLSQDKWLGTINAPFRFTYGTKAVYPGSNGQEGSQNYVYVTEGDLTKRFWRYDLINNVWARITDSPASFYSGAQITGEGDVIYALPGIDYADTTTTEQRSWKFLKYTISTNTWTDAIEHLPDSLYVRNYYELGNRLLYIPSAGAVYYKSGTNNGYFYRYDVERDTWLAETATTNSRNGCLLYLASQNAIYYFSGGANLKFRKYLITDGTWTDLSNPPFGSGYDSVDSDMFYPGGDFIYLSDGCNRSFVRYSISKDDWDLPVMPPSSYCRNYYTVISAGGDGDSIYVGGYDVFYKYSISNRTWTTLVSPYNSAPALRWDQYDPQMVYPGTGSYLYSTRGRTTNNFWRYSVSGNSWEALTAPANSFGSGHQLVGTPSKIYALRGDSYNNFWAYDPSSNTWASSANTPDTVNFGSSLCYVTLAGGGNFIYATRGNRSSDFWRYSLSTDSWESMAPVPVLLGGGYGGTSLVYPGVGDYLYLTQGTIYSTNYGASTVFRYSLANNTWEEARSLCPQVFLDDGQLIYPGSGDYLYGFKGSSRWDFSKFLVFKKGSYISDVKIAGRNQGYDLMSWNSNVNDSTFEFRARSSDNFSMADATEWEDVPVRKKGDDLTASYPYVMDKHKYIQYRLMFFADDLTTIPEISDLTLSYNKYPPAKELVSSAYNSKEANNRIMDISWSQTQPSGSDLRFQLRTAPDDSGEPGAWTPWLGPGGTQTFTDDFSDEAGYAYAPTIEVVNGTAKLKKIYEDYQYTQRITLDNTASTESYLDAIVTIEVDSLNEDFWGHVKSDGSDIRFSDGDGNSLSYSIDSPGTSFDYSVKYAKIKLKIPEIPSGEKTTVYLKYGKADAVSESDPKLMTVPSSGLAGYWTFNEGSGNTVEDFSGNNNNGVLYNSPSWVDGKIGKALSFNGSNTYVDFGNSNSLKITGSQTISMWLKPTDLAARRNPVDKAYGGEGTMTLETSGTISYYYGTSGTNGGSYQSISSAALKAGVWTHIAIVRDLDNMKLRWYINGVKTNEATANYAAAVASGNNLRIGLGYAGAFLGLIDEVAIYNQALSDTEVADLFSGTSSGISIPYCFNLVETSTTSPSLSGWEYREEIRIDNGRQGAEELSG